MFYDAPAQGKWDEYLRTLIGVPMPKYVHPMHYSLPQFSPTQARWCNSSHWGLTRRRLPSEEPNPRPMGWIINTEAHCIRIICANLVAPTEPRLEYPQLTNRTTTYLLFPNHSSPPTARWLPSRLVSYHPLLVLRRLQQQKNLVAAMHAAAPPSNDRSSEENT